MDPKKNRHAHAVLERDVRRIGAWFEHQGLHLPWETVAADLWTAWTFADLVPEELRGLTI
jgi:serine/threonine-protein kinase RIO1